MSQLANLDDRSLYWKFRRRLANVLRRVRNRLFFRAAGGLNRPVFHDASKVLPELLTLDENLDVIRAELQAILPERQRMPKYHELDPSQQAISGQDDLDWRVFFLHLSGDSPRLANAELCPRTVELLEGIPNVLMAFFSILEPGKCVPAHEGPSYTYLRYHTALEVPERNPPSIRVKDRHHTWKLGESLFFDDSWEHEVTNHSDGVRVVLIVDVIRPTRWPLSWFNRFVLNLAGGTATDEDMARVDRHMSLRPTP